METSTSNVFEERYARCELEFTSIDSMITSKDIPFKKSTVTRCFHEYPLRILIPKHASNNVCQWVYNIVFGGGLVSGDRISVQVHVKDFACVLWTSQSFQKVYKISGSNGPCYQNLSFHLGPSSFLAVLSDPVVCYGDADFRQTQEVRMNSSSNLILLDWYTAGRTARGEWWTFKCLFSSINVYLDDKLVVRESLELSKTPHIEIEQSMREFGVFGTCIFIGPFLQNMSNEMIKNLNSRSDGGKKPRMEILFTASPLYSRDPNDSAKKECIGCVLRIGAANTALAYEELSKLLLSLTLIFGDNPFENKF